MNNFPERFRVLRHRLGLDQAAMAARLLITRNYLSQIENGRVPHMRLIEALKRLETEAGHEIGAAGVVHSGMIPKSTPGLVEESQTPYAGLRPLPSAADLAAQSRALLDALIAAAGDRIARHYWLQEQLRTITPPRHWASEDRQEARLDQLFDQPSVDAGKTGDSGA